ncbi:MAG TPA: hypothetical protein VL549_15015 [Gemmatimonadales bacterium]|jgi:hypothetical protein|nr:hypothetical protein [Gemmatimonadales bacterium]
MAIPLWLVVASAVLPQQIAFSDSIPLVAPPVLRLSTRPAPFTPQRPKAVELSDAYYIRLKIHRYTSYAIVPLYVAQYAIGRRLYNQTTENESLKSLHGIAAGGIYGLYAVNTVTGAWNLWDTRAQREGRTRRYVHSALMVAAGAGFVATSMLAPDDEDGIAGVNSSRRRAHRTVAIASFSTALAGHLMMLIWNK